METAPSASICYRCPSCLSASSMCHGHVPRQKLPIGGLVLWKDGVTLSHLFCSLMRAPCIVRVNRAQWVCGICIRMVYVYWNDSTLFLSCFRLSPLILHLLSSLQNFAYLNCPYLVNILQLAGTSYSMEDNPTFLYFAYGSNLLKERLQIKNPSAIIHCVATLQVMSSMHF